MRRPRSAAGTADAARRPGGPTPRSPRRAPLLALAAAVAATLAACSGSVQNPPAATADPQNPALETSSIQSAADAGAARGVPAPTPAVRLERLQPQWNGWTAVFSGRFERDGHGTLFFADARHNIKPLSYSSVVPDSYSYSNIPWWAEAVEFVFLDREGSVLRSLALDNSFSENGQTLCPGRCYNYIEWNVTVPDPPDYAAYQVVTRRSEDAEPEIAAEVWRSANTPTAAFTNLAEGEALDGRDDLVVTVELSDPDNDRLFITAYLIHNPPDLNPYGIPSRLHSVRHPRVVEPSAAGYPPVELILRQDCPADPHSSLCVFPSPVQQAQLRVLVSDGANWTVADSPTFSVALSSP